MLIHTLFLFPCFCCLFWVVVFLCRWKRILLPARFGAIALGLMTISLLFRGLSLTTLDIHSIHPASEAFCTLSFFSCLFLYVRTLTNETPLSPKYLLLFLPGLLVGGALTFFYFFIEEEKTASLMRDILSFKRGETCREGLCMIYFNTYRYVYKAALIGMATAVLLYAWISHNRYRERLETFFSSPDDQSLEQSQALLHFLFAALLYSLFILEWEYLLSLESYILIGLGLVLWGCALFYLGYHTALLKYTAADFARELEQVDWQAWEEQEEEDETARIDDQEQWNRIRQKLLPEFNRLMDEEHLFLHPNLRLDDVVHRTQSNRNYISILLREEHQCGFPEYINRRRIEYAKLLVHHHPELTQEQIAEKCGFTYSSSFSRTFKQSTGTTFRQWAKSERG